MVLEVFLGLALVALVGSLLRYALPDLDIDDLRQKLNRLVLTVLLPALNFKVIYGAHVSYEFWQVPLLAAAGLLVTITAGALIYHLLPLPNRVRGSLILAGAFGNVTYFGIPLLQGLFPAAIVPVTTTAILYEMTITPTHLVLGSALASLYGAGGTFSLRNVIDQVVRLPLLWAIVVALAFNLAQVPLPAFVLDAASLLASAVSGLMILSLGMALRVETLRSAGTRVFAILPCLLIKLALSPLIVWIAARAIGVGQPFFDATIIEAAMPTQLVALVVADRFRLDVEWLALAVFLITATSFATLPLVHFLL